MNIDVMQKNLAASLLIGVTLFLSACGSDDSSTAASTSTTVSGVAATGAPIASGNIVLHCQNNWNEDTITNSNGQWSMVVPTANLPCAIKASASGGGQNYYSFTTGSGSSIVTNITPLTSLALAKAGITPDDTWFNALDNAGLQSLSSSIAAAITALKTALQTASYTLPSGFNPFAVAFSAEAGNSYDDLLEQLKAALAADSSDFATLLTNFASGGALPEAPEETEEPEEPSPCTGGDDKLVFTSGPSDFCGFSKGASANTIENYYQFTSTAGSHGTTYVKFNMNEAGTAVEKVTIENDDYAFACGTPFAACTGVSFSTTATYKQFSLSNTSLAVVFGASEAMTVNGLLIHSTTSSGTGGSDTIATPTLETGEFGVRFASNGTIQSVAETGVERFFSGNGDIVTGSGDSAGLLTDAYLNIYTPVYNSFGLTSLPNSVGTYSCGDNYGAFNGRNITVAYAAGQGYSSMGTGSVSGFSCSITVTQVGSISGSTYTGYVEGTFKARLFKTGAPVNLATSIVVSGTFRLGN
ncbi:MAG: hypothetical protein ACRERR_01390 [Moraxellaceae bacterium]